MVDSSGQAGDHAVLIDVNQVINHAPSSLSSVDQDFLSVSDVTHERRAGKPLSPASNTTEKPRWKPWEEDGLQARYPKLLTFYQR